MAWKLNQRATRAKRRGPLLTGLPATTGRHGGCRLLVADNGALLVGTGDAATGTNPRDLTSLGGKTLRLDRRTGKPWPGNRYSGATNARKRYVFTYGHRNVQGLAQRRDGSLWSVEHGSFRDDEVNRLVRGGDYGWHPVPGYNEQVPMTDRSLPGRQHRARWRSGNPTVAPGGATFVSGKEWGALRGDLAVAVLKDQQVLFLDFDSRGRLDGRRTPQALQQHGRIRTVVQRQRRTACSCSPTTAAAPTGSCGCDPSRCRPAGRAAHSQPSQIPPGITTRNQRHRGDHRDPRHPARVQGEPGGGDEQAERPPHQHQDLHPPGREGCAGGVQEEGRGHPDHADERPRRGRVGARAGSGTTGPGHRRTQSSRSASSQRSSSSSHSSLRASRSRGRAPPPPGSSRARGGA